MNMNIWSLTAAKMEELKSTIEKDQEEYDFLNNNSVLNLWKLDIEQFTQSYKAVLDELDGKSTEIEQKIKTMKNKAAVSKKKGKKTNGGKKNGKKRKKSDDFIDDDEEEESDESEEEYSIYSDSDNSKKKKQNNTSKRLFS